MIAKQKWVRWTSALLWMPMLLTGCHKPYIMTQLDYSYYNAVTPETNAPREEDISLLTANGKPRTVADPAERKDWELSLEDCKRIALQNNKRVAYLGFEPGVAGTQIQTSLARFDATVELGSQWAYADTPLTNTIQVFGTSARAVNTKSFGTSAGGFGSTTTDGGATNDLATTLPGQNLMSIFKRHATGGLTRIFYDIDYQKLDPAGSFIAINPYWRSTAGVRLEQPLLQGAGVEFNRAPVLIARANHEQSIKTFEDEVQKMLRDVEVAYWDLYFKFQELYSREAGLEQALATWRIERNKEIYGKGTAAEVAQAREQLELFRAQRLVSLNDLLNNERELRELMGIAPDDEYRIIPKDEPTFARYEPDWQLGVSEAMQFKPDIQAARFQVRAAELEVMRQRNGLLPDLSVGGSWSLVGLDNQWDQSIDRLTDADFESWTLFFRARRQVGERAANAAVRRSQLVLSQRRGELRNLEHTAIHALALQYQRIISNYQLIQAQKDRRQAAADQLEAREDIYREGVATIDLLLQAQSRFADALREESQAVVDYNKALAEWEFARGRTLANDNVVLAEQRISLSDPKLKRDRAKWLDGSIPLSIHPGSKVHADPGCPPDNRPLYPANINQIGSSSPISSSEDESVPPIVDPAPDSGTPEKSKSNSSEVPEPAPPSNSTDPPLPLP
jgi:outer membrane protein TolC